MATLTETLSRPEVTDRDAEIDATSREVPLVLKVATALEAAHIRYCQWKGRLRSARWAQGLGDIDLLVDRTSVQAFTAAMASLGFRLAMPLPHLRTPGVLSFIGPDPWLGRLIHVHAHFRLIIGPASGGQFRLPIEEEVLDSAILRRCFRTPSPEFELALFILSSTLRHRVRDWLTRAEPEWLPLAWRQLTLLEEESNLERTSAQLVRALPQIDPQCFHECIESLRPGTPRRQRVLARYRLEYRLAAHALRSPPVRVFELMRRLALRAWARLGGSNRGKQLASGGIVVALDGADGAGKSTCARALATWLSPELDVFTAHLGRPPRSIATIVAGGALKVFEWLDARRRLAAPSRTTAHVKLLRYLATARDRYRLHRRAQRAATAGAISICERYPMPPNRALVGPSAAQGLGTSIDTPFAQRLRRMEERYYERITPPDLVLVLRVDAENAVERKTTEPEDYVRARADLMWNTDWSGSRAIVVDASPPLTDVLATLRSHVWNAL